MNLTKSEQIIESYQKKLIDIKRQVEKQIDTLKETKSNLSMELEIAIRVGHNIQEDYIRFEIEQVISQIDLLSNLDFNIKKDA